MTAQTAGSAGSAFSRRAWIGRRLARHRLAMASAVFLIALAALAALVPALAHVLRIDPGDVDLYHRFAGPSAAHWLGTDELGRDVLMRLLYGGRVSLAVGLTAAVVAAVIGTAIGLPAGYFGGRLDAVLMRVTDGMIALPLLPLLVVLAAVDLGKLGLPPSVVQSESADFYRIVAIIALVGWTTVARLVRGAALTLRETTFVRAAEAVGAGGWRIMTRHILPNVASPVIVATTLSIGNVILFESVLSFLGLGIQPPVSSWGNMMTDAQELVWTDPALAIYPGLSIFATVIAFNFLGDGLQDALDPRAHAR
jgi:peptide/nickel transport system permease protein